MRFSAHWVCVLLSLLRRLPCGGEECVIGEGSLAVVLMVTGRVLDPRAAAAR